MRHGITLITPYVVFGVSALGLVAAVALTILLLGGRPPYRSGATRPPSRSSTATHARNSASAAGADATTIAFSLAHALENDDIFVALRESQRSSMIEQSSELLATYLNAGDVQTIENLVHRWGGAFRSARGREFNAKWWPPADVRDGLTNVDASRAAIEALRNHITSEHDGEPVISMNNRLSGRSMQMRGSAFEFPDTPPRDTQSTFGLIVPARYADGSKAVIAFWFQWDENRGLWIPRWLEFEREGRPYFGAPLF